VWPNRERRLCRRDVAGGRQASLARASGEQVQVGQAGRRVENREAASLGSRPHDFPTNVRKRSVVRALCQQGLANRPLLGQQRLRRLGWGMEETRASG
jgi:hypothetical protein